MLRPSAVVALACWAVTLAGCGRVGYVAVDLRDGGGGRDSGTADGSMDGSTDGDIGDGSAVDGEAGPPDAGDVPSCTDGVRNGDELGTDCGGSCAACTPSVWSRQRSFVVAAVEDLVGTSIGDLLVLHNEAAGSPMEGSFRYALLDSEGATRWSRYLPDNSGVPYAAIEAGPGFFLVGTADRALVMMTIDSAGLIQSRREIVGPTGFSALTAATGVMGGAVSVGYTESYGAGDRDVALVRVTPDRSSDWAYAAGDAELNSAAAVAGLPDGTFILVGETMTAGRGIDALAVRFDAMGNLLWARSIGGSGTDTAKGVAPADGGGVIIGGTTDSSGAGGEDAFAARLTEDGDLVWARTYGGTGDDGGRALLKRPGGGYLLAGAVRTGANDDMLLVHLDGDGAVIWARAAESSRGDVREFATAAAVMRDGGLVLGGAGGTLLIGHRARVLKLDTEGHADACAFVAETSLSVADAPMAAGALVFETEALPAPSPVAVTPSQLAAPLEMECN